MRVATRRLRSSCSGELEAAGQLGLSDAGAQRAYLRAQRCIDEGLIGLRLDIRNAFNSVLRPALKQALQDMGRTMPPGGQDRAAVDLIMDAYCGHEETIWIGGPRGEGDASCPSLANRRGVTQGCPAGSLAFDAVASSVMQNLTVELGAQGIDFQVADPIADPLSTDDGVVFHLELHDDVFLAARSQSHLLTAYRRLRDRLRQAGLEVGLGEGKSMIVCSPATQLHSELLDEVHGQRTEATRFAGLPLHVPTDHGVASAQRLLDDSTDEALKTLQAAEHFQAPQDVMRALVVAGPWSRLQYHLSTTAASTAAQRLTVQRAVDAADTLTVKLLGHALGQWAPMADAMAPLVAWMPRRYGGMGVTSAAIENACISHSAEVLRLQDALVTDGDAVRRIREGRDTARALAYRELADFVHGVATPVEAFRLAHQTQHHVAATWTHPAADFHHNLIPSETASVALLLALLGSPFDEVVACGERPRSHNGVIGHTPCLGPEDDGMLHLLRCAKYATPRHNAAVRAIAGVLSNTRSNAVLIERTLGPGGVPLPRTYQEGEEAPGDLAVKDALRWIFADVSVTAAADDTGEDVSKARDGRRPTFRSVTTRNRAKIVGQGAPVIAEGAKYAPLAFSAFGACDRITTDSINLLAAAVSKGAPAPPINQLALSKRALNAAVAAITSETAAFALSRASPHAPGRVASRAFTATTHSRLWTHAQTIPNSLPHRQHAARLALAATGLSPPPPTTASASPRTHARPTHAPACPPPSRTATMPHPHNVHPAAWGHSGSARQASQYTPPPARPCTGGYPPAPPARTTAIHHDPAFGPAPGQASPATPSGPLTHSTTVPHAARPAHLPTAPRTQAPFWARAAADARSRPHATGVPASAAAPARVAPAPPRAPRADRPPARDVPPPPRPPAQHPSAGAQPVATGTPPASPGPPHGPPSLPSPAPACDQPPRPPADTRLAAAPPPQPQPPPPAHPAAVRPTASPSGTSPHSSSSFIPPIPQPTPSLAQPVNRNPSDGLCMRTSVGLAPSTSSLHPHPLHHPHLHPPPSSSHPSTGTNHTAAGAASSPQLQTATRNPLPHRLPKARGGGRRPKSAGGPAK